MNLGSNKLHSVAVFYFSGTGNAKQIAVWLAEFAAAMQIRCELFNIATTDAHARNAINPETLIVIISPIHGFNFPKITLDFIRHFPKGKNKVALMNTRAGMKLGRLVTPGLTGVAFFIASVLLKNKGYTIVGQIPFDMPSNWISIHPSLSKKAVKYLHKVNYARVEKHAKQLFSGKPDFHANKDVIQDIIIAPVSLGYYLVGRFVFSKSYFASKKCNHCQLCINQCPVKAIIPIDGRPFWTFKCESCMKCMNFCPNRAIESAHGLFAVTGVIYAALTSILFKSLLPISAQHILIKPVLETIVFIVLIWFFYKVQHLLLRNRICARLIAFASLTYYRFWGRYTAISDDAWK